MKPASALSRRYVQAIRRYAPLILWLAVAVQVTWVILNATALHRSPGLDGLGVGILLVFGAFAALHQRPRWRWLAVVVRVLMAADFLLAVADRFGVLGPVGAAGVSWGDFRHFVDYTRSITVFLPGNFAPTLAVAATVVEVVLGLALLLGFRLQLAALGATLLLIVYGTAMTISLPLAEQFHYSVFLLAAGMLVLATLGRTPWNIDALLASPVIPTPALRSGQSMASTETIS